MRTSVVARACSQFGGGRPRLQPVFGISPALGWVARSGPGGRRLYLFIGNFCRLFKNPNEHRPSQLSGLGVLVGGMVRSQ